MQAASFVEKLKHFYTSTFDLEDGLLLGGQAYDVYGHFNVDNSRYVLVKKAKLWEANSQEHLFIRSWKKEGGPLTVEKLQELIRPLEEIAEPQYVRGGEKYPPKNHMYSFLTLVVVTDGEIEDETMRFAKKYKFGKTYLFNFRGYLETRLVLVSTRDNLVTTNQQGKELKKAYLKLMA